MDMVTFDMTLDTSSTKAMPIHFYQWQVAIMYICTKTLNCRPGAGHNAPDFLK